MCEYYCEQEKEIVEHMKNEHDFYDHKPYKCNQCDYDSKEFTSFRRHTTTHVSKGLWKNELWRVQK